MKTPAEQISEFICRHYERARTWHPRNLEGWIEWNIEQRFCITARCEKTNEILGLIIVRPVMHPELAIGNKDFDVEGDTYFVDMAIALPPKLPVLQVLGFAVLQRFGMRDKIAFQRNGVGPVIVSDAHEHRRKLLRSTTHGRI
jgi:hypothetical protein